MERDIESIRVSPLVGDQVQGEWDSARVHFGPMPVITVQARVGNLVATSSNGDAPKHEIRWQTIEQWAHMLTPGVDVWVKEYRVISVVCPESD